MKLAFRQLNTREMLVILKRLAVAKLGLKPISIRKEITKTTKKD
jgi:hypothetical protein